MSDENHVCEGYCLYKNTPLEKEWAEFFDWLDGDVVKKEDVQKGIEEGIIREELEGECADYIGLILNSCYLAAKKEKYDIENVAFKGNWNKKKIRDIGTSDVDSLVTVDGKIQSRSGKREYKHTIQYRCEKGHYAKDVRQRIVGDNQQRPSGCNKCEGGTRWEMTSVGATEDRREVILQGLHSEVDNPDEIRVVMENQFVNEVEAGDKVRMNCVVHREDRKSKYSKLILYCVGVEKEDELDLELEKEEVKEFERKSEEKDMLEYLAPCVAPHLVGEQYEDIRKAVLLQLFAGEFDMDPRDTSHILIAGDPSVGKSDILEWVKDVSPTSQFVSGENATTVGLTGGVEERSEFNSSSWMVSSGAMAKANKGVCCIDELDKLEDKKRESLNNVLSNQIVSISKIVNTEIKAEANALMACNPKDGRVIDTVPVEKQLPFHHTFFPRLDLIYILKDSVRSKEGLKKGGGVDRESKEWISRYVKYARKEYDPVLTEEAEDVLLDCFSELRTYDGNGDEIRVTHRYKNALERLARSYARLNLRDEMKKRDIKVAFGLVKESLGSIGVMDSSTDFDIFGLETGISEKEREFLDFADEYDRYSEFIFDGQEEYDDSFDELLDSMKNKDKLFIDEEKNLVKRI